MKHPIHRLYLFLLMGLLTVSPSLFADVDAERETLSRLAHEIVLLESLILESEAQAPAHQRVRFRYDWLRADLRKMHSSIQDHIDAPTQPRSITPMRGDYRR